MNELGPNLWISHDWEYRYASVGHRYLGSENQSVSGFTTICLMQRDTSPSHRVDKAMECCPTPLQWLCEVAGYWQELEHTVIHVDPEHPKHAQQVTCLVSTQDMKELGNVQPPGIVYRSLRHGAVHYHADGGR